MIRCPPLDYRAPTSLQEATAILAAEGTAARPLAGGTDLIPNMKRRQQTPAVLVSLRGVPGLKAVEVTPTGASLGSCTTLATLESDARLAPWTALQQAATSVASPHIRNTATLGGNLCLDTRCNYYNQSYEWRKSIDFCMKVQGSICWVAPGSPRCWAISSTDTAPALIALGARVVLASTDGERELPLAELYNDDGIQYLTKRPEELLTTIKLADPTGWRSTYSKLRRRGTIDFPELSVAVAIKLNGNVVQAARIVFGAVASYPVQSDAAQLLVGNSLTDELITECATRAAKVAKPLDNTDFSLSWRKKVASTYVERALRSLTT